MKVKEKNLKIFTEINKIKPLKIFEIIEPETIDNYYLTTNGERTLATFVETFNIVALADIILSVWGNSWDNLFQYHLNKAIDLITSDESITTHTGKTNSLTNKDLETLEKISSYDSDVLENNRSNTDTHIIDDTTDTENIQRVKNMNPTKINQIEKFLTKNLINDIMFKELNNYITLSIYNF